MYRLIVVIIMRKSLFEIPTFTKEGLISGWILSYEVHRQTFDQHEWTILHVNKRSLTLKHNTINEIFFIGARTFNKLQKHDRFVKYVKVPNPKNDGQELNWIKIDNE